MVDEGLENETEEDDEQEGQPTAAAPPQPDSAPDSAPPPPPPPVDMASLRAELMGLIQKWQGGAPIDPAQADAMKGLATAGIAAVKAGDAPEVAKAVTAMKGLLGAPSTAAPPSTSTSAPQAAPAVAPAPGKFVAMQKSRLIWDSARKRVAGELQALRAAITDAAKGDQEVAAIMAALNQLDDILVNLDESLLDKLDELLSTTEPGAHAKLLQEAKAIIAQYVAYTQSSQLVAKLDGNTPFGVKLSVASTMGTTLKALQATIV